MGICGAIARYHTAACQQTTLGAEGCDDPLLKPLFVQLFKRTRGHAVHAVRQGCGGGAADFGAYHCLPCIEL